MRTVTLLLRSRWSAAALLVVAVLAVLGVALAPTPPAAAPSSRTGLAASVESVAVERAQANLPDAGAPTVIAVWDRTDGGRLSPDDLAGIARATTALGDLATPGPPPQPAPDGTVALVPVPLELPAADGSDPDQQALVERVDAVRQSLRADAPDGLRVQVTGGPAFTADLTEVFAGADLRLLLVTAGVVALLLLITYRSPVLLVVPLLVVAATEQTTLALADQALSRLDLPGGGQTTGIASVLVFGAATDYALLLIARYREQLRAEPSALVAMRTALARTGEAIVASGGTVVGALVVLLLASTDSLKAIAVACIVGVLLAMLSALVVLPAALVLIGRRAFWPFVPRVGDAPREGRVWGRLGAAVARRPARVLVGALVVVGALALAATGIRTGLSQNEQFRDPPEAVTAAQRLADALPAGATAPLTVITVPDQARAVADAAAGVPGVASASPGRTAGDVAEVDVVLDDEPGSAGSREAVAALRTALDDVGDGRALVGGAAAEQVDVRAAQARDRTVVIPLVLLLVTGVLALLLRALVAPLLLVASVVASYGAALGAGWLVFTGVFGFPALEGSVVVLSFLFLVALGVDYTIFLTTRAREEARAVGTREGMLAALRVTGGVITSAGVLLAAVFAVLGVLPLIALTQVGVIVCLGVLLDTLLVRTVVVPALALVLGERFWWPGHPARGERPTQREGEGAAQPARTG